MLETDYWDLVTVPRLAWDETENPHPRQGERGVGSINRVEIHWPAAYNLDDHGDSTAENLQWEAFHEGTKGWTDLFYNIVGDTEGNIYEGRDITVASQSDLRNTMTFLINHGIDDDLTLTERNTFGYLIWKAWGAVDPDRRVHSLGYHSQRANTSCPGDHLRDVIETLWQGWLPPQAQGGPYDMYIEDRGNSKFAVVRPQGVAVVTQPDHWRQVIKAGRATGVYKSPSFDDLDAITTPHEARGEAPVLSRSLSTDDIDAIANRVLDLQAERLEG